MPDLIFHHFPGACSTVARCALEEAGLDYRLVLVNLKAGEQFSPEHLKVSPLGKVPLLMIDGVPLSENAAIQTYIAAMAPEAGLFPATKDPRALAEAVGGLSFCGATLHPIVRGLINPIRITAGEVDGVRTRSLELAAKAFAQAEKRIAERGWWLGTWSMVDVYLDWAFQLALSGGFDGAPYPALNGLRSRLMERPAFARTMALEAEAKAALGL